MPALSEPSWARCHAGNRAVLGRRPRNGRIFVKADDFGVYLAQCGGAITTAIGQAIVYGMPPFLKILSFVGLVAMLWVGGGIVIHGLHAYGLDSPEHAVKIISEAARTIIPSIGGLLAWLAGAITSAVLGVFIGAIAAFVIVPILTTFWRAIRPAH